jgi:hypothetical protein
MSSRQNAKKQTKQTEETHSMPQYRVGEKIDESVIGTVGHGTLQPEQSEVGGRSRSGFLLVCPYCHAANWCLPDFDRYDCAQCSNLFR